MSMITVITILLVCQLQMLSVWGQQQFTLEILAHFYQHNSDTCCRSNCNACTYTFTFCVEGTSDASGSCTLGQRMFQYDTVSARVNFDMGAQILTGQNVSNPMIFTTSSGPWPGGFRLIVSVGAQGGGTMIPDTRTFSVPGMLDYNTDMISLTYTLTCTDNYYGSNCEVECIPRDDAGGHYNCDPITGDRICLPGFINPDTGCVDTIGTTTVTTQATSPTTPSTEPPQTTTQVTDEQTTEPSPTTPIVSELCPNEPCENGGICEGNDRGSMMCNCDNTGYEGTQCEIAISTMNTATTPQPTGSSTDGSTDSLTDPQTVAGGGTQANQLSEGGVAGLVIGLLLIAVVLSLVGVGVGVMVWRYRTVDTYKLDPVKAKQSLDNPNYETVELQTNSPGSSSSPANVYQSAQFNQAIEHVLDNDNPLYFSTTSGDYALPPDEENDYDLPPDEQGHPFPPSQPPPRAPRSGLFDNPDYAEPSTIHRD